MTSTNSLLFIFLITNLYGKISSPSESFKTLLNSNGPIDATIHINNIIKNGVNSPNRGATNQPWTVWINYKQWFNRHIKCRSGSNL